MSSRPREPHALWIAVALGLLASVPVLAALVRAIADGWMPLGDEAVIVARAHDVLTSHSPLVGQFSAATGASGIDTHSLGPLEYWLLALPARIGPAWAPALVAALVNVASVVWSVVLARRHGGLALALPLAVVLAFATRTVDSSTLVSAWNPSIAWLPLVALVLTAWAVALGDHRLLPLAVLLASYLAQCHLTYVAPALVALVVAVVGDATSGSPLARGRRGATAVAALVAVVAWLPPLVEQLVHDPGNLVSVARSLTADKEVLGLRAAWHAIGHSIGLLPTWTDGLRPPTRALVDLRYSDALTQGTGVVVVLGLVGVLVVGVRRGRRDLWVLALLVLGCLAGYAAVARSTPAGLLGLTVAYTLRWGVLAGALAWALLAWVAWERFGPGVVRRLGARAPRRGVVAAGGAVVVLVGAVLAVATSTQDRLRPDYAPAGAVASRLDAVLGDAGAVRVAAAPGNPFTQAAFDLPAGLVTALARQGRDVAAPPAFIPLFGPGHDLRQAPDGAPAVLVSAPGGTVEGRPVASVVLGDDPRPVQIAVLPGRDATTAAAGTLRRVVPAVRPIPAP